MDGKHPMKRWPYAIAKVSAVLLLACLTLSGCRAATPTANDISGTWEYSLTQSTFRETSGGTIEFKPDGTFTLKQIPVKVLFKTATVAEDATTDESGTWEVVESQSGVDAPSVAFHTTGSMAFPGKYTTYLVVRGEGSTRSLVGVVGDPDSDVWYSLRKKP
jgi:hypothetical protein